MKLRPYLPFFSLLIIILVSSFFLKQKRWVSLLDKDLSKWETYQSYRHQVGYKGEMPVTDKGDTIDPIGYHKNVNQVFSVIEEGGEPILKITGEIYGCVFTKEIFENYHLKLKVKWGNKKWIPRLDEDMDSGILYHSQGECGVDYWRSWMLAQEFQIIEKSIGDYWNIASSEIDIKAVQSIDKGIKSYRFKHKGKLLAFGSETENGNFCQSALHAEKPNGQWNTLELICFEDKSVHIVNGVVVMALAHSRYKEGSITKPLTKGKIQLQSEAAEVFFKDIKIRKIEALPKTYQSYFE
jgi:Domain of Unknown Function (DUF1080)